MEDIFTSSKIIQLQQMCAAAGSIAILSHANPDGDAVGSGLALSGFLRERGYDARFFVPNRFPKFLECIPQFQRAEVYADKPEETRAYIGQAGLIICCDFNQLARLEKLAPAVEANVLAPKVLIDHHLAPPPYELAFSDPTYCSTAQLVYDLIGAWGGEVTPEMATAIYVGIATDTGNLSFGHLSPAVYRTVAELVERGVDPVLVAQKVFNTQSESRLRMVAYLLAEKMQVHAPLHTAYITLTKEEKIRFAHQVGDTEGVVNLPLSIEGIHLSALFVEALDHIKISFRSQGPFDVNSFASRHFGGGGHRNAAGGKFFGPMAEAVALFEELIKQEHPNY